MEYVRLGNSGLKISKVILGCMSYGEAAWQGWVLEEEEGVKHIKAAYDAGVNAFDTANFYSNGQSEVILGKAIKKYNLPRDEIVVMTKVYFYTGKPGEKVMMVGEPGDTRRTTNQHGLSRKHIFESVKHSLERLQLDYVDLLQCHRFDPTTPIEETMQALHDVVKAGYVRYIGMSSCHAYQFHIMQNYAIANNLTPFISMQNHYNLVYLEEEREMIPTLKHFGVGSIPWSPIARGLLTRPRSATSKRAEIDRMIKGYANGAGTNDIVDRVEELAKKKGISMAQVATAWSLHKPGVSAPIVGTTSLDHLMDILKAVQVKLTEEEIKFLEEPYQPRSIMGHA